MIGWKWTWYSLGDKPGGMQPGNIHFHVLDCSFRRSFIKMVPCPSIQLQLILASMKMASSRHGRMSRSSADTAHPPFTLPPPLDTITIDASARLLQRHQSG